MRTFNLTTDEPIRIGDVEYGVVNPSVADELAWDAAMQAFRAEPTVDALLALQPLVQACIPDFDVSTLGGGDLVRLGYTLIKGIDATPGDDSGNASGAEGQTTPPPSSPTTSDATPAKSSPGPRKKSARGQAAPTA
jgi:hypothetical protein